MRYYSYDEFEKDVKSLAKRVRDEFNPDAFVAIARGGMTIGHYLAIALESRNLFALNSIHYDDTKKLDTVEVFNLPDLSKFKKILIVDDIIDSGESMVEIKRVLKEKYPDAEFKVATIFYKHHALVKPEFSINEANDWIEFCWDIKI
ncbi:phosphoribosyltransferase [Campylobacter geochelonis]|uniref:Phosphoribosyltransferase n=1 Tax=Campylobacter geochelonis TaxID=1780362 RepID=A0A128EGP4_9BACT|nr:phosphoribosyltransferase [Campylobacter geochelonis]QKF71405.1 putative nucleotide phosphoribosyltransferase [Campylobacter geochelonis]CZE47747.1 phosphoribosyltransferase [Campylobacter geochelonis]CZE48409.1 phosphoribosyltransferase [Campylobacter geochelonis]CZE50894.1 phosphoribosyltransferase [Campylobacter geochelonis]